MKEKCKEFKKGKVEEVRKEVVWPKNRVEGGRNKNGVEQVRLSNVRSKIEGRPGRLVRNGLK